MDYMFIHIVFSFRSGGKQAGRYQLLKSLCNNTEELQQFFAGMSGQRNQCMSLLWESFYSLAGGERAGAELRSCHTEQDNSRKGSCSFHF